MADINTVNAADELVKAEKLLAAYKKTNLAARNRMGGPTYKGSIEARISTCKQVIEQCQLGGPPEIEGTGSAGPGTGLERLAAMEVQEDLSQMLDACLTLTVGPKCVIETLEFAPKSELRALQFLLYHLFLNAVLTAGLDSSIDPSLIAAPPAKKPRNGSGPRHRKIVAEDPMGTIKDHITATMLANFVNKWLENATEVEATEGTRTADRFLDLRDSAVEIIERVAEVAEQYGFSDEQLQWEIQYDGGAVNISHLTSLHDWLVATGLMIGNIQMKPAVKKAGQSAHTVKIIDDGKTVTMTPARLTQARTNPSAFPGCVEAGLETIVEVLKNRNGNSKCFSCNVSGVRGQALTNRPDPPLADHPFLDGCKCPLNSAALELWMIKQTAGLGGVPQRGAVADGGTANRQLALNPDILKVIAASIEIVSGHDVNTLLSPEMDRLTHTLYWALILPWDCTFDYSESLHVPARAVKCGQATVHVRIQVPELNSQRVVLLQHSSFEVFGLSCPILLEVHSSHQMLIIYSTSGVQDTKLGLNYGP
ncbi:hypothetical protein B0H13DRAFT_1857495 [Mycena leptocephala]|nr:hypothetical protein B0H13DRAFT_1857495 [Mycena leptocephala]